MISGVYGLLDPETGHLRYIGLSKDIHRRYKEHCNFKSYGNKKINSHLTYWLKSLKTNPELIILEECSIIEAPEAEIFWIAYYKGLGCKLVNNTFRWRRYTWL